MALRQPRQTTQQSMGIENRDSVRKTRQSSAPPQKPQRRALNEIGNLVRHFNVQASVEISKQSSNAPAKPPVRRSTRLSCRNAPSIQPITESWGSLSLKETPGDGNARSQSKVRVVGPTKARITVDLNQSNLSCGPARRKMVPQRAPRLTMKPPPVETPPEERIAAQNLIRQSLAAERRRCTMAPGASAVKITRNFNDQSKSGKTLPEIPIKYDIDLAHSQCFWMVSAYSKQLYAYLQKLDRKMTKRMNTAELSTARGSTRMKLVEWMASAHLQLHLLQETFQLSVSILDRYLLLATDIKDSELELLAVTCLSLAIKYEELLTSLVKELLSLTRRPYSMKEFVEMEAQVLKELSYQVAQPIPLVFLRRYNIAANFDRTHHSYGKYLIDLAQLDFNLARLPSSALAAAAVYICMTVRSLQVDTDTWNQIMVHYTSLTFAELKPVASRVVTLVLPGGPDCRSLRRKYSSEVSFFSSDKVQRLLLELHDFFNVASPRE